MDGDGDPGGGVQARQAPIRSGSGEESGRREGECAVWVGLGFGSWEIWGMGGVAGWARPGRLWPGGPKPKGQGAFPPFLFFFCFDLLLLFILLRFKRF